MEEHHEIIDPIRAEPVGSCIYCGAQDKLTDEHIIPLALGGRYILPKSSCINCATITSDFERRVLRGFMLDARTVGEFPTRRPKERPKKLPLQIERDGVQIRVDQDPENHPGLLHLPLLEPPGFLVGREYKNGVLISGYETISFGKNPINLGQKLEADAIQITTDWEISSFARLLAKIAYSFSVASLGLLPRENIFILPLILGEADDASFWLGSKNYRLDVESKKPMHALAYNFFIDNTDTNKKLLLVRVKLFASSGVTGYEIVVGRF